jgi:hypothetical protein
MKKSVVLLFCLFSLTACAESYQYMKGNNSVVGNKKILTGKLKGPDISIYYLLLTIYDFFLRGS